MTFSAWIWKWKVELEGAWCWDCKSTENKKVNIFSLRRKNNSLLVSLSQCFLFEIFDSNFHLVPLVVEEDKKWRNENTCAESFVFFGFVCCLFRFPLLVRPEAAGWDTTWCKMILQNSRSYSKVSKGDLISIMWLVFRFRWEIIPFLVFLNIRRNQDGVETEMITSWGLGLGTLRHDNCCVSCVRCVSCFQLHKYCKGKLESLRWHKLHWYCWTDLEWLRRSFKFKLICRVEETSFINLWKFRFSVSSLIWK